jgi:hypothetical protein
MDPKGTPSGDAAIDRPQRVYDVTYDLGGKTGTLTDLTQPAAYDFGGYYTDTNGKGQQLLTDQGKVTSAFTNTYFSPEATAPTLYAKWSGGSVQVRDNTSTSEGYRFIGWEINGEAAHAEGASGSGTQSGETLVISDSLSSAEAGSAAQVTVRALTEPIR